MKFRTKSTPNPKICVLFGMTSGHFNIAETNVSQRLSLVDKNFNHLIIWGYTGFVDNFPVDNGQPLYLGVESGKLPIKVAAGTPFTLSLSDKEAQDNLANWYVGGTATDGVCYYAW